MDNPEEGAAHDVQPIRNSWECSSWNVEIYEKNLIKLIISYEEYLIIWKFMKMFYYDYLMYT